MLRQEDTESVYARMTRMRHAGCKQIAVLLDPDKTNLNTLDTLAANIRASQPDYIFVGGSSVGMPLDTLVLGLKRLMPDSAIVLFPGDARQVTRHADAILFLSLLSGRNPEYLIGQQVRSAAMVRNAAIEVIPTAYLLIDGGTHSAVERISATRPMARDDVQQIADTALAGSLMGMTAVYLEAGSGAEIPVPQNVISRVRESFEGLLIVGGGIKTTEDAGRALEAGADMIVVGNHLETHPEDMKTLCDAVHAFH